MKTYRHWMMALVVALSLLSMAPAAFAKGIETRITLSGSVAWPGAKGQAKYKVDGTQRELQVEVENVLRLAGTRLKVLVNGALVGTMPVSTLGTARLSRNTDLGQAVPQISSGSRVVVRTGADVVVASGRFP